MFCIIFIGKEFDNNNNHSIFYFELNNREEN